MLFLVKMFFQEGARGSLCTYHSAAVSLEATGMHVKLVLLQKNAVQYHCELICAFVIFYVLSQFVLQNICL